MARKRKTSDDQGAFGFPEDADGDDRGRAPRSKRKTVAAPPPGVWENCARGLHRLCATEVIPNEQPIRTIHCACSCHPIPSTDASDQR